MEAVIKQELPPGLEKLCPQTNLLKQIILNFEFFFSVGFTRT